MSATTDNNNSSKVVSAVSAITSLASSLLPNAIDLQQLNQLITSLIRMPSTDHFLSGAEVNTLLNGPLIQDHRLEIRREKHRQTERVRHNTIITLIRQLSQMMAFHEENESQAMILSRSARYVLFLSHVIDKLEVDSTNDSIDVLSDEWLQSLYPLYERAFEDATNLIQSHSEDDNKSCVTELSAESVEALNRSRDHCFPLISMSEK